MSIFRRGGPEPPNDSPRENPYDGLRAMALGIDPAEAGLPRGGPVWGALFEMTYPNGGATLVCLADGTTSLYTTTGGGVIGGGAHETVAAATLRLLGVVAEALPAFAPDPDAALPPVGGVAIRALTYDGRFALAGPEAEFAAGRHPQWPVFRAAHEVLTQLRLMEQGRR